MNAEIAVTVVGQRDRERFARLTFPAYREAFVSGGRSVIGLGASAGSAPIGLALLAGGSPKTELLSLYVAPAFRKRGLGRRLLAEAEAYARSVGTQCIACRYTTDLGAFDVVEHLLNQAGWAAPLPRLLICKARAGRLLQLSWADRCRLPRNAVVVQWSDISEAERQDLAERREQIPPAMFPLDWENDPYPMEEVNSAGLRLNGRLCGWFLTHRLDAHTVRYSCLYIDPPFDRLAGAIALLMEGVARQCAVLGPHTFAIWGTSYGLPGAIAFLKRRMAPALDSLRESKESGKFLHEAGTAAAPRQ